MSMFIKKVKTEIVQKSEEPMTEIFVPYEYKEQAKKLKAQFNSKTKKWYTLDSNKDRQKLVDIFHVSNFVTSYHGTRMRSECTTEKQREDKETEMDKEYNERYNDYKESVLEKYGKWTDQNEKSFGAWYSVKYLHE